MIFTRFAIVMIMLAGFLTSGCATGKNMQGDVDALNSKVSALESQLSAKEDEISKLRALEGGLVLKDKEIANLQNQLNDLEKERKALSGKLDAAQAKAAPKSAAMSDIK